MGKTTTEFTMSLDGFVAGPYGSVDHLFDWYASGDTPLAIQDGARVFKVSKASADLLGPLWGASGALVTGRRDFEVSNAWGGQPPFPVPTFIVTHTVPQEWAKPGSPFTFVTAGLDHALALAQAAAGDKPVDIGGTTIVQQLLQRGLLDEIQIDLVPVLLGRGIRLFDQLGVDPIKLERIGLVDGGAVTHLRFRVLK